MKVLGIIPARKNSRRLLGKNTRLLAGKPLVVWTIETAQRSKHLTDLICSTDDEEVMRICLAHCVDVIVRPAELATDTAKSEDVVLHVIQQRPCDYVCLLQPTSPFRAWRDIDRCINGALGRGICKTITESLPAVPNGAVYVASVGHLKRYGFEGAVGCVMPKQRSIDIDTLADFEAAERWMIQREGRVT